MASDNLEDKEKEIPLSGIPLARRFYEIAQEEYQIKDIERMRDGCEKAYRAAMEALDVLLALKGYRIDIGQPEAHGQLSAALSELVEIDPKMQRLQYEYNTFAQDLHGSGFYSRQHPKTFERQFKDVQGFIDTIEKITGNI